MSEKLQKAIFILYAVLFFLVPMVWTPLNFELFEFNKMVLVYFLTVPIIGLWIIRMAMAGKIIFRRTALDIPLLLFLGSQIISTVISIDRHTSIFGYYSRFHGGLLSTVCYLSLYWALVSNGKKDWVKRFLDLSLISGIIVAIYGVAEHFGIDKNIWVQDVQRRVFSTLGQPNWLGAYLNILLMVTLGRILNFQFSIFNFHSKSNSQILKPKFLNRKSLLFFLLGLFYLCLLYTKSKSGFLGLGAGWIVFWLSMWFAVRKETDVFASVKKVFFGSTAIFLVLSLTTGTPFTPNVYQLINKNATRWQEVGLGAEGLENKEASQAAGLNITPSGDIRKIVWQGAEALWKKYPVFGTGVETFGYAYYWVRPREHNLTSEWDFLYNKAHNEYFNFAATTGTVGLLTYLGIPLIFGIWTIKKLKVTSKISNLKKQLLTTNYQLLATTFLAAMATILVTNFFGFSVVAVGLWFFLLPGLTSLTLLEDAHGDKRTLPREIGWKLKVVRGLTIVLIGLGMLKIINYWYADVLFAKGKGFGKEGNYKLAYDNLKRSVILNPSEPAILSQYSLSLANLAVLSDQAQMASQASELVGEALAASEKALKISPYHLNLYKERANLFFILSKFQPDYLDESLKTLLAAINLAPTDAKLFYNAGLMFEALDKRDKAVEYLNASLELKPNYDQATYWLAEISKK